MKQFKPCIVGILVALFSLARIAWAFDPATDCLIKITEAKLKEWKLSSLQQLFNDYTNVKYSTEKDGQFVLCFEDSFYKSVKSSLVLNSINDKSVLISGLNIDATQLSFPVLLTLSGSNITLFNVTLAVAGDGTAIQMNGAGHKIENSTLTSNGKGTAIQVNAPSPQPSPAGGEGVTTIGPDNKLNSFERGIVVSAGAGVLVIDNEFLQISPQNAITYSTQGSNLDITWIGKHINQNDATIIDRIAGKISLKEGETCSGSVELLLCNSYLCSLLSTYAKQSVAILSGDSIGLKAKDDPADKPSKKINTGDCYFDMTGVKIALEEIVGFTFTNASGHTVQYLSAQALVKDLPDVINVPGLPIYVPGTTLGMDGADTGSNTVFVQGYQPPETPQGTDNTTGNNELYVSSTDDQQKKDSKGQQTSGSDQVGQGSSGAGAGCGGQQSITQTNPSTGLRTGVCYSNIMWSLIALGGLPVLVVCRRFFGLRPQNDKQ